MTPACVTATVRAPSRAWASSQPPTRSSSASSDSPPCGAAAGSSIQRRRRPGPPSSSSASVRPRQAPKSHSSSSGGGRRVEAERLGGLARAGRRAGPRDVEAAQARARARGPRRARARRAARRAGTPNGGSPRTARGGRASGVSWKSQFADSLASEPRNAPTRSIGWPQSARWCEEAGVKPARSRHCDRRRRLRKPGDSPSRTPLEGTRNPQEVPMPDAVHAPSPADRAALPARDQPARDLALRAARRRAAWCSSTSSAPTRARRPWCRATTCTSSCTTAATCSASPATEPGVTT